MEKIAYAAVYQSSILAKFPLDDFLPDGKAFHESFDITPADIEGEARPQDSPDGLIEILFYMPSCPSARHVRRTGIVPYFMSLYVKKQLAPAVAPLSHPGTSKPSRAPVAPPMPTFRPIVLTHGSASEIAAARGASVGPSAEVLEEGELPAAASAAATSSAPGAAAVAAVVARLTSPDAELSPALPPSDVRSGDQNNHNDSADGLTIDATATGEEVGGQQQEQASTRKRTRSLDPAVADEIDGRPSQRLATAGPN